MKKIIFVTSQFKSGGGNRVFVELANSISVLENYELAIIYPNNSLEVNHYKVESSISISVIGNNAKSLIHKLWNCFLLFRVIIKELKHNDQISIIISDPVLCVFLFVIPKKYYPNVFRFIQADDYKLFDDLFVLKNRIFLFIFKLMTYFSYKLKIKYVFNSSFTFDKFVGVSKRNDVPKIVIHPAVNPAVFYDEPLKKMKDKLSICLIARDHPLKKLDDFIGAWQDLADEIKQNIDNVYMISTDTLKRFDLSEFTLIRPNTDMDIAASYRKADIFISTSLWEGFSLPPLEALNCGLVILSSDSGGIKEYAVDEYNALLFSPGDKKELQDKLARLILDKPLRELLYKNSKEMIQDISWEKSAKKLISFIKS